MYGVEKTRVKEAPFSIPQRSEYLYHNKTNSGVDTGLGGENGPGLGFIVEAPFRSKQLPLNFYTDISSATA